MTQQLPDLAQRGSLPEHLRGKRVSEYIGAGVRRVHSRSGQGALDKR
jgi:hypothetical protein